MTRVHISAISLVTLLRDSGYVSWIGRVAERDAVLTEILTECGAVPYVRTNLPQTLMVWLPVASYYLYLIILFSGQSVTTLCSEGLSTLPIAP